MGQRDAKYQYAVTASYSRLARCGLVLSLAAIGRKLWEVLGTIAILGIGRFDRLQRCGVACQDEHRFWVAEIADLHQKIVILFDDGETVMGRELDYGQRTRRSTADLIVDYRCPQSRLATLALACDGIFNAKPQYFANR